MIKRTKYGSKSITIDGITFHSKKEGLRYQYLKSLAGSQVFDLELQPSFVLVPSFKLDGETVRLMKYSADFKYKNISGVTIVEDVKASKTFTTDTYKIRVKLFKFNYCREGKIKFYEIYEAGDIQTFY